MEMWMDMWMDMIPALRSHWDLKKDDIMTDFKS